MKETYYIRVNEFKPNDFNYGSMLVIEGNPFSYDIGNIRGSREDALNYITKRTLIRDDSKDSSLLFKYQSLEDVKMMRKHLQEEGFFESREVEIVPAVFASDEYNNELLEDLLKKHSLQRIMLDTHNYQND